MTDLIPIHGAPLRYAPENEQGVVAIFAAIAKPRLGMTIELIRTGYPDCEVVRRGKRVRVEFEFRSRSFKTHLKTDPKVENRDAIVCWIHDWPAVPDHLEVIELRRMFGMGQNVWVQAYEPAMADRMARKKINGWSVPASAGKGDFLLLYRSKPDHRIEHVLRVSTHPYEDDHWKLPGRTAIYANFYRVGDLPTPVPLTVLKRDRALRHALRGQRFRRASAERPVVARAARTDRGPRSCQRVGVPRLSRGLRWLMAPPSCRRAAPFHARR